MNCELAREALSARLDGEPHSVPPQELDEHVAGCAACLNWQAAAHVVTRRVRLTSALAVPDRTEHILVSVLADQAAARAESPRPLRGRTRRLARAGLSAAALAQFVIILPAFTGHAEWASRRTPPVNSGPSTWRWRQDSWPPPSGRHSPAG